MSCAALLGWHFEKYDLLAMHVPLQSLASMLLQRLCYLSIRCVEVKEEPQLGWLLSERHAGLSLLTDRGIKLVSRIKIHMSRAAFSQYYLERT